MPLVTCAGLPAEWLNGWLAAVGATVIDARIRLHWTAGSTPVAVLSADNEDPASAIAECWPHTALLNDLPIAENWRDVGRMGRKVPVDAFSARARSARGHEYSWALSSTMTDLCVDQDGEVVHAPFDPPAPKGSTLHDRLLRVHGAVQPSVEGIAGSLHGRVPRVQANGLGFDQTRLGSLGDDTKPMVDPVVETLAFFGLSILPMRGAGIDQRLSRSGDGHGTQKGWVTVPRRTGQTREDRFRWPAWNQPLDRAGIDALLDLWNPDRKTTWKRTGVLAGWRSVPYRKRDAMDPTAAFGSERL